MIGLEMPMPKSCAECRLTADGWCYAVADQREPLDMKKRPDWCPLVDLSAYEDDLR